MKKHLQVKAKVVAVQTLSQTLRSAMFAILHKYYEGVSWDQFNADLDAKDHVILLRDRQTRAVCGFSTLVTRRMKVLGRPVICVFSGDTVLEQDYWGSPALGLRFLSYLFAAKVRSPLTPVYWMLISKGYKTYLMMARNFAFSYPHRHGRTPAFEQAIMDEFYGAKFGAKYIPSTGIIELQADGDTARLRQSVAPITAEMKQKNADIAYFEALNPSWQRGDELACTARMTLDMPLRYFLKKMRKNIPNRRPSPVAQEATVVAVKEQKVAGLHD